jgi:hypothetical protein
MIEPEATCLRDQRKRSALARHNERQGATEGLAQYDHDLALAGLGL